MQTQADTVGVLKDLVAFDTTSRLSNLPLLDYVIAILERCGIVPTLVWNDDRTKANLWATIGPSVPGGIILSGHTDTVPVDGQEWTSDPFELVERDRLLYARGSCDMKGFLAAVLDLVPRMAAADLRRPIHLAFSHDEELGCVGVRSLIARLKEEPPGAAYCIVGEPTDMVPVIGHKSGRSYKVRVRGREAHSSLAPRAVNAIDYAAELIVHLRGVADEMKRGRRDELYDVPHATLSTGLIRGGSAINIVPRDCEFQFEYRCLDGEDPGRIFDGIRAHVERVMVPRMQAEAPECGISFEAQYDYPSFAVDPAHELVTRTKSWAGRNAEAKVAYGTEAGHFANELGIATIVCGPGSIAQAHKPDEYVARDQLTLCKQFLEKVIAYASEPS